jgi:glycerol uptake facilitator protein
LGSIPILGAVVVVTHHFPTLGIIPSEIIGTGILILLGDGVVAAVLLAHSKAQNSGWIVITFGWGMAVMVAVYIVGYFDGAHLNPAVTLAIWIHGGITGSQAWKYFVGEIIGAMVGAVLVWLGYYLHWAETEDPGLKLAVFSTGPAIRNYAWNLITEIFGTFVLVVGIFGITGPWNVFAGADLAPLLIGLLVFSIGLSLGGPTGYAINPARDLGPRIIHAILPIPGKGGSDWSYAWVPVLGPLIGGALGAILFDAVFGSAPF